MQRLQRFATYGYLKQVVLKMIASDLADSTGGDKLGEEQSEAVSMVTALRFAACPACYAGQPILPCWRLPCPAEDCPALLLPDVLCHVLRLLEVPVMGPPGPLSPVCGCKADLLKA